MKIAKTTLATLALGLVMAMTATAAGRKLDYRTLSTSRSSTMQKELNAAAADGYRFLKVSNSPNVVGGKELVVVTVKNDDEAAAEVRTYKVLSARGTSALQKKLQAAGKEGYEYLDQTTLPNIFGGTDVIVILERKGHND